MAQDVLINDFVKNINSIKKPQLSGFKLFHLSLFYILQMLSFAYLHICTL